MGGDFLERIFLQKLGFHTFLLGIKIKVIAKKQNDGYFSQPKFYPYNK